MICGPEYFSSIVVPLETYSPPGLVANSSEGSPLVDKPGAPESGQPHSEDD